jgi:hypothetical protein
MKKLKLIFAQFPTFAMMQEMEAKTKPKEHYLIERLNKLKRLSQIARIDKNDFKAKQADRLIQLANRSLRAKSKLLYAHIEQKEVIN